MIHNKSRGGHHAEAFGFGVRAVRATVAAILAGGGFAADGGLVNQGNPPNLPLSAAPSNDARYDQLGRRYFLGVSLTF